MNFDRIFSENNFLQHSPKHISNPILRLVLFISRIRIATISQYIHAPFLFVHLMLSGARDTHINAALIKEYSMMTTHGSTDNSAGFGPTHYDPDRLLNFLIEKLHVKNDAALSRVLGVAPPVISKIRRRRMAVSASLLIRMHEISELSIRELRTLMGDHEKKFRDWRPILVPAQGRPIATISSN